MPKANGSCRIQSCQAADSRPMSRDLGKSDHSSTRTCWTSMIPAMMPEPQTGDHEDGVPVDRRRGLPVGDSESWRLVIRNRTQDSEQHVADQRDDDEAATAPCR